MRRLLCLLALVAPASAHAQAPALVPGPSTLDGTALTQEVRNAGDDDAPAGKGTLTGAAVTDGGPRDYPTIAAGAAASNAAPFSVGATAGTACGDPIDLSLALGGSELPLRLVGGAGGTRVYANAAATDLPAAGSGTSAVIVGDVGTVWDANVRFDRVRHEFAADLTLELVAPDGTAVTLADRRGGNGQDFDGTLFDDQALAPVGDADAPFAAQLRPESPLGALRGRAAQGRWELRVTDHAAGDAGAIEGWSLELIADDCDTSTPDPEPGGTGTQAGGTAGTGSGSGGTDGTGGGAGSGSLGTSQPRLPAFSLRPPASARRFAARGVAARIACRDACRFRIEMILDRRTAKRLRMPRRQVSTGWRRLPAGEHTTMWLRPRGATRFRRAGKGAFVTVRLITFDGHAAERRFRVRRR